MQRVNDQDIHEPVVNPVAMNFFTRIDPTGMGEEVKFPFSKTVLTAISTTAKVLLTHADGKKISEGDTENDYFGFADSLGQALKAAADQHARFNGAVDVSVSLEISERLVILTDGQPFYNGAVRGVTLPAFWRLDGAIEISPDGRLPHHPKTETMVVWKNGERLEDYQPAIERLQAAIRDDVSGDKRRGSLHVTKHFPELIDFSATEAPTP